MANAPVIYKVEPIIDPDKLKADINFSTSDLTSAMMSQAALYAYYAQLHFKALKQVQKFELLLSTAEALVDKRIRDEADEAKEKLTEPRIAKMIATNKKILSFRQQVNEANAIEGMCKAALEALKQRRDMLVQIGVSVREEMKGEVAIRAARANGEAIADRRSDLRKSVMEVAAGAQSVKAD